jgi:hypothetical protein
MKNAFCLVLMLYFAVSASAKHPKIHVLMIIDKYTSIAPSCIKDAEELKRELKTIETQTGLKVVYYECNFTPQSATKAIRSIKCGADDVLLFYYSGHGYRYADQTDLFPYMAFQSSKNQKLSSEMLSLKEVSQFLKQKKARLTLVLGDLCNSIININEPLTMEPTVNVPETYRQLFLYSKGDLIATSSKAGQPSIATSFGSVWTMQLLKIMREAVSEGRIMTWEEILTAAKNKTASQSQGYGGRSQDPVFQTNVIIERPKPRAADVEIRD